MPNPSVSQDEIIEKTAALTNAFLRRRLDKLQGHIGEFLNINPFLVSALRDFHGFSTLADLAQFLFISHMSAGHATSFGKLIDERVLPDIFGTIKLSGAVRRERRLTAAAYDEIDHIVNPTSSDQWSLLSLKAGPWTIQNSTAHALYNSFKSIGDFQVYGSEIVVGVFYGNAESLTNKYQILKGINPRQQQQFVILEHVRVLVGKAFWSWLNGGVDDTQKWILEGTRLGTVRLLESDSEYRSIVRDAPGRLAEEIARKYSLTNTGDIDWLALLMAINDPAEPSAPGS